MATPSVAERVRHGLEVLVHRPHDADREREWALRESDVDLERHSVGDSPGAGLRATQPYSLGVHRRH